MIYLDYNATTPCDESVVDAMLPYFSNKYGNPAATTYSLAWQSDEAVKEARQHVANAIGVEPEEIIFTSGSTEACNLAIKGLIELYQLSRPGERLHIILSNIEHSAVLDTVLHLSKHVVDYSYLEVDHSGIVKVDTLESLIQENTVLIAVMLANNETGIIQPIEEVSEIAKKHKIFVFSDTTQAIGKISTNMNDLGIDMACISAHKIYGPKGVGALYISKKNPRVRIQMQMHGGGHENEHRSGTLNVPGIVGLGAAISQINTNDSARLEALRDLFEKELLIKSNVLINGKDVARLPNVSHFSIKNVDANKLISKTNHILAFSIGSACNASKNQPSHVLQSMNIDPSYIKGSIRISIGKYTTRDEIIQAVEVLSTAINELNK